jgi:hypothetical protein
MLQQTRGLVGRRIASGCHSYPLDIFLCAWNAPVHHRLACLEKSDRVVIHMHTRLSARPSHGLLLQTYCYYSYLEEERKM